MNTLKKASTRLFVLSVFMVLFLVSATPAFSQAKRTLTDSEYSLCKAKLERAHQGFYRLSYSETYVRDVIMPGIRNERGKVAPNFPQRVAGTSSDVLFKDWMENHWDEYAAYMLYLNKQHEKWRLALSDN